MRKGKTTLEYFTVVQLQLSNNMVPFRDKKKKYKCIQKQA